MEVRNVPRVGAGCVLLLLAAAAAPADSESPSCRLQDCPNYKTIRHYEELGCTRSDGSSECCPTRFNCSSFLSLDKKKCHYRGKAYDPGTQIQEEIKSVCTPSCACVEDTEGTWSGESTFHCAHIDCPEYFASAPVEPGCYRTYDVNHCCSTGIICGNATEARQDIAECTYNGKTYLEGQYMEVPDGHCVTCVCQPGFNGSLEGPWCRKFSCDYTLGQRPSDLARCAPIYWGNRSCCPISWHCPSYDDIIFRHSGLSAENEDDKCTFGDYNLHVGDDVIIESNRCVKCRCHIPPFMTCSQIPDSECTT